MSKENTLSERMAATNAEKQTAWTESHKLWLRKDFEVEIYLPENMTTDEAKRLGRMISTLGRESWE